jgi:hypothetical protein
MAHNVTEERYCLRWHARDWGNDTGEFYCSRNPVTERAEAR